jgi:hypothetical protein
MYTKEGEKSFRSEIDDFFIPTRLIVYAQVGGLKS